MTPRLIHAYLHLFSSKAAVSTHGADTAPDFLVDLDGVSHLRFALGEDQAFINVLIQERGRRKNEIKSESELKTSNKLSRKLSSGVDTKQRETT